MPQMAPLSWISLNITFSLLFMIYITMMYFIPMNILISKKCDKKNYSQLLFKW